MPETSVSYAGPTGISKSYKPTEEDLARWENNFTYHTPKDGQPGKYAMLRSEFRNLAMELLQWCPPSRERSLALTALEESSMWANASIARNE